MGALDREHRLDWTKTKHKNNYTRKGELIGQHSTKKKLNKTPKGSTTDRAHVQLDQK